MPTLTSTNPARNYEPIGEVPISTPEEIKTAAIKARAAQPAWQALGIDGRIAAVQKLFETFKRKRNDLALISAREMGRPIAGSELTVDYALGCWEWYLANARHGLKPQETYRDDKEVAEIHYEPAGVAAVIAPWNFPFSNFTWGVGQSLLAGNTIIFKISEEVPLLGKCIDTCFAESGMPAGVFNQIYGAGDVGATLMQQNIDMVYFTGSTATGKKIYQAAAEKMIPVLLEMGGSDAGILFEDANLDKILETLYGARFRNSGQVCNAMKRLIIQESRADEVTGKLAALLKTKKLGDTEDRATDLGPLVSKRQLELLESQVEDAKSKGAKIVTGGKRPDNLKGAWYEPTILTNIKKGMRVWHEETFGPVLPIVTFKTYDEAITLARDSIYGLGSYIFTEDKKLAMKAANDMHSGMSLINNGTLTRPCNPFGGRGMSGIGMENSLHGFHEVSRKKLIVREA